jgi:hypothetical protein
MIDFLQHIRGIIMATKYEYCDKVGKAMGDRSFCSVIALATACQIPHKKAYAVMNKYGRCDRDGAYTSQTIAAIGHLGFDWKEVTDDYPKAKTPISAVKELPKDKTFMVRVSGHIFTIRNGVVEDWSEGRKHRVTHIFEITPTQSKNAQRKAKRYNKEA